MPYEPKRRPLDPCPIEEVVRLVGGKWKARILLLVSMTPSSFSMLQRDLPRVAGEVLSTQLQSLIEGELVERHVQSGVANANVVYRLTELGRSLIPVLDAVAAWGMDRLKDQGQDWEPPSRNRL